MPALVHFRPSEPLSPTIYCPHCTESNLIVAHVRNDAKGHVWTAPGWQEESSLCSNGRSSHVFGLFARYS